MTTETASRLRSLHIPITRQQIHASAAPSCSVRSSGMVSAAPVGCRPRRRQCPSLQTACRRVMDLT